MKTTIHNCQQGSPDWLKLREDFDTASEAPASQGRSKYTSRSDLLKQKSTGICADVGAAKQALFDRGHASEESSRSIAERLLDDDLYPITATASVGGINLLASLDGATMDRKIIWEHKLYSEKLAADVRAGNLDPHYTIQMDQQLLVTGAKKCMFMASDGTEENMAWCWYESNQEKFDALIAGWQQFHADLATYAPQATEAAPVGKTPETLPALHIEVTGMVTASNLAEYKAHALAVFGNINRELVTDAQFADAEKTVKWCSDIESRLTATKQHALSQTASIDELFRTIDDISAEARRVRLELDKLVKARKETIRTAIVSEAAAELVTHIKALNQRLGAAIMPTIASDFPGAVKGLKSIDSMRDKVATELARCKIEANATADRIGVNLKAIDQAEFRFLFADRSALALKDPEFVAMAVKNRVDAHKAAEIRRIEAERIRIAEEERVKAEAAAKARADAEIAAAAAVAQAEAAAKIKADTEIAAQLEASRRATAAIEAAKQPAIAQVEGNDILMLAGELVAVPTCKPDTPPALKLGVICTRLGVHVTADFLRSLGFAPAATDKNAKLYHEADFQAIGRALIEHIESVLEGVAA